MKPTSKKSPNKTKPKPRSPSLKAANAKLLRENQALKRERDESLDREAATSDILRMIASSPMDLQSVLDGLAERAAKLCEAEDAAIFRVDGNSYRRAAHFGPVHMATALGEGRVIDRDTPPGRAIADRATIHVHDLQTAGAEFPGAKTRGIAMGLRTVVSAPLLREGMAIGAIHIRRREIRPFSGKQIKLLETFAAQAVIAIENVRLFQELKEALEQQTATSEILGVIASSPTDIQPVLDAVAESAARLCDSRDAFIWRRDNDVLRIVATHGRRTNEAVECPPIDRSSLPGRAVVDGRTIHVKDLRTLEAEFPWAKEHGIRAGVRTSLVAPLLSKGIAIGAIHIRRREVRPFADKQIKLLETFADQAVIAIENVRLFKELQERNAELREALEHQTATSEVLGIISRSPTDVQPVLDAIVESAARVCGIDDLHLRLREGNAMVPRAHCGDVPVTGGDIGTDAPPVRWVREHGTLHVPDVQTQTDIPIVVSRYPRTFLVLPFAARINSLEC